MKILKTPFRKNLAGGRAGFILPLLFVLFLTACGIGGAPSVSSPDEDSRSGDIQSADSQQAAAKPGDALPFRAFAFSYTDNAEELEGYLVSYAKEAGWDLEIQVENSRPGEDREIVLNRLAAELSQGKGPDLMFLDRPAMEALCGTDGLTDLSRVLPEELIDQVFPSVVRVGQVGEALYGLGWFCGADALVVPDRIWEGENWTVEDVLSLLEKGEKEGKPFARWADEMPPSSMLYHIGVKGIREGDSPFVNWQERTCCFDTPEFIRLLEACQRYGDTTGAYPTPEEKAEHLKQGETMVMFTGGNLAGFSQDMSRCQEDCHLAGYPSAKGSGFYVQCYRLMAVNKEAAHFEEALGFLEYLAGERMQKESFPTQSVRRDVLTEDAVVRVEDFGEGMRTALSIGEGRIVPLEGKKDGTSWLPEYTHILEEGICEDWDASVGIAGIVMGESEAFFDGDKSAQAVADVIQNRVQLYLDESR